VLFPGARSLQWPGMRVFRGPSESEGFFVCVSYAMSGQVDHTVVRHDAAR